MSSFSQDSRFTGGMGGGINDLNQPAQKYRKAVNLSRTEWGNLTSMTRVKSDTLLDWGAFEAQRPSTFVVVDAFYFDLPNGYGEPEPAVLVFAKIQTDSTFPERGAIYLYLPRYGSMFLLFDMLFNDFAIYQRAGEFYLNANDQIDCRFFRENDVVYAIFCVSDAVNVLNGQRPYCLPIPGGELDVSTHDWGYRLAPYMGIAHNVDCLYLQEIVPQSELILQVDSSTRDGNLRCGSYQFGVRYVNLTSGKTSRISFLTHPIPIVPNLEDTVTPANVRGGGPGEYSSSSIEITVEPRGYHKDYFDAVQFFIVEWIGSAPPIAKVLEPEVIDSTHYTPAGGSMVKRYTGNEATQIYTVEELLEVRANIDSAVSLEEREGRLFLLNVQYSKLESGMTWQNAVSSGQTIVEELYAGDGGIDPLSPNSTGRVAFGIETNTYRRKGYRGDEVYRFAAAYYNKFGEVTLPDRITFTGTRYSPQNRPATWMNNWASPDCPDWRFASRNGLQTSVVGLDCIKSLGLSFDIGGVPQGTFGVMVLRRKRIRNILASTPIIHAMSVMGGYAHIDGETADRATILERPWLSPGNYDGEPEQNTYEPKVLAYGALQDIRLRSFSGLVNSLKRVYYPRWAKAKHRDFNGDVINGTGAQNSLLYLYPPEMMANDNNEPYLFDSLDGARLEVFDCVMTTAYSALRDGTVTGTSLGSVNVFSGKAARYGWIYAPLDARAYWSHQTISGRKITDRVSPVDGTLGAAAPPFVEIGKSWIIGQSSLPTQLPQGFSSQEPESYITKANGLFDLWAGQAKNEYGIFRNSSFRYPGFIQNQRAILVSQELREASATSTEMIYDPTWFIKNYYIDGGGSYNGMFAGQPLISATTNSLDPIPTIDELGSIDNPWMMPPGTGIPIFIANITKGLPDNRYGLDSLEEWIPTGTTMYLDTFKYNALVRDVPIPQPVSVWGGDTFVSQFAIKIRDNAPVIHATDVQDTVDNSGDEKFFQYIGAYGDKSQDSFFGTQIGRVTGYESFFEYLHIHLESEINTNYLFRAQDAYPSGFKERNAQANDLLNVPSYIDHESVIRELAAPVTYLYNFGYSQGGQVETYFSKSALQVIENRASSRIHYTPQRVPGQPNFPFQRWLTGDYYDLDRSAGAGTRLVKVANDRMVVMQENDIVVLALGLAMAEDGDGAGLTIRTANVVGDSRSTTGATSLQYSVGAKRLIHAAPTPFGVYFIDQSRRALCMTGGDRAKDLGIIEIKKDIDEFFFGEDTSSSENAPVYRTLYEAKARRVWFVREDRVAGSTSEIRHWRAVSYLPLMGQWESFWDINDLQQMSLVAFAGNDNYMLAFTNDVGANDDRVGQMYARELAIDDWGSFLGRTPDSEITYVLNNTEHTSIPKVLHTVQIQGDGAPSGVQAKVRRKAVGAIFEQISEEIPPSHERRGTFLFNLFHRLGEPGTRIIGEQIEITVKYSGTGPGSLESAHTTYRISYRARK